MVDNEIAAWKVAVGATSDAELARMLGYNPSNITLWRTRGSIPKSAVSKFQSIEKEGVQARILRDRRQQLGNKMLYQGLCLAIWLAPSLDAFGRRFGAGAFTGTLRNYASLFPEIEVSCAEEIEARLNQIDGDAVDAFEALTREAPEPLMERIVQRARRWRYGE